MGFLKKRGVGDCGAARGVLVYDQQRRTFREAVCEERAKAADGDGVKR
jgi:hypothetical protein